MRENSNRVSRQTPNVSVSEATHRDTVSPTPQRAAAGSKAGHGRTLMIALAGIIGITVLGVVGYRYGLTKPVTKPTHPAYHKTPETTSVEPRDGSAGPELTPSGRETRIPAHASLEPSSTGDAKPETPRQSEPRETPRATPLERPMSGIDDASSTVEPDVAQWELRAMELWKRWEQLTPVENREVDSLRGRVTKRAASVNVQEGRSALYHRLIKIGGKLQAIRWKRDRTSLRDIYRQGEEASRRANETRRQADEAGRQVDRLERLVDEIRRRASG